MLKRTVFLAAMLVLALPGPFSYAQQGTKVDPAIANLQSCMTREDAVRTLNGGHEVQVYVPEVKTCCTVVGLGSAFTEEGLVHPTFPVEYTTSRSDQTTQGILTKTTTTTTTHVAYCSPSFSFKEIRSVHARNDFARLNGKFGAVALISLISDRWPMKKHALSGEFNLMVRRGDRDRVIAALELLCPNLESRQGIQRPPTTERPASDVAAAQPTSQGQTPAGAAAVANAPEGHGTGELPEKFLGTWGEQWGDFRNDDSLSFASRGGTPLVSMNGKWTVSDVAYRDGVLSFTKHATGNQAAEYREFEYRIFPGSCGELWLTVRNVSKGAIFTGELYH